MVGRENCDILLLDGTVSRRHAEVTLEDGEITVTDLGSTNGTQVDGKRLAPNEPAPILPGAVVRFGSATLALPGESVNAAATPAEATIVTSLEGIDQTRIAERSEKPGEPAAAASSGDQSGAAKPADAVARLIGAAGAADIFLSPGTLTIGRKPGNDVVLADAFVSGKHAELICDDSVCTLVDLGSTNGTTVNGVKLEANQGQIVVDGDEVQIGQTNYRFETLSAEESEAESSEEEEPIDQTSATEDEDAGE
jgi:pSer/pThr/pTyr-binding forkhead associated (FHA) protein